MRRSARGVSLYVILSYVTCNMYDVEHPPIYVSVIAIGGHIAPGSDRIRRALTAGNCPNAEAIRAAAAGATARRLVNCGWSLSRYVAHSFIHRNTH
jgi:hypothetical protein